MSRPCPPVCPTTCPANCAGHDTAISHPLAEALAAELGEGWWPDGCGPWCGVQHAGGALAGPDRQRLTLKLYDGRLLIRGDLGTATGYRPRDARCEIGVNAARSMVDIAKDVRRRLLPEYSAVLVHCLDKQLQRQAKDALRDARVAHAIDLVGGVEAGHHPGRMGFGQYGTPISGGVIVTDDTEHRHPAEVNLRLSWPYALEVLELVSQIQARLAAAPVEVPR